MNIEYFQLVLPDKSLATFEKNMNGAYQLLRCMSIFLVDGRIVLLCQNSCWDLMTFVYF